MENQIVIDAKNAVLGRLASFAAKQALLGRKVIIVNCNEAVISGSRANIVKEYQVARARGGASLNGPFFPKHPFRIVKRTVRGMVRFRRGRGDLAIKNVICYDDIPEQYQASKKEMPHTKNFTKTIKLSELSKVI